MRTLFLTVLALILALMGSRAWSNLEIQYYRGQSRSMIDWKTLDPENWLDLRHWKDERQTRDTYPKWQQNQRERRLDERVGRVIDCIGECYLERGAGNVRAQTLSSILEGDEFYTEKNSFAWIFLMDGTIVRLAPESSVSFMEINISKEEIFFQARINRGDVFWLSRDREELVVDEKKETDSVFLPLKVLETTPLPVEKQVKEEDLYALLDDRGWGKRQFERLNTLIKSTSEKKRAIDSYAFIVLPNGTFYGKNLRAHFISLLWNKSYIKNMSFDGYGGVAGQDTEVKFYYRGFANRDEFPLQTNQWYEIAEDGRSITETSGDEFKWSEFVVRRIPTIMLAREIFMERYSPFLFRELDSKMLAEEMGYRLWTGFKDEKGEIPRRVEFLKEFTRRIETTTLSVSFRYKNKMNAKGENLEMDQYNERFFEKAITNYFSYTEKSSIGSQEREMLNSTKLPLWKRMNGLR